MKAAQVLDHFDRICDAPDAIPRLRRFILDLAVRGKIVDQDVNDEPASELLKRIQAEKDRLVIEGKISMRRRLPRIEPEEIPFDIPAKWEWTRLGEIGLTQTGATPSKNLGDHFGNNIPFIKPGDLYFNRVDYANEGLSEAGLRDSGRVAPAGSLLMVCIGTIGKCQIVDRDCSFNQQINSVSPYGGLSIKYLLAACLSEYFQKSAWAASARTTIAILNKGKWELLIFPIPPLDEQHRIVAKLDELMALCDRLEAAQAERESRRDKLAAASLHRLNNGADADEFREHTHFHLCHLPRLTTRPEHIQQLRQTILNLAVRGKLVRQDPNDEPVAQVIKRIQANKALMVAVGNCKAEKPLDSIKRVEVPFELPRGWEWRKIDSLVRSLRNDIRTGPFGSSLHKEDHRLEGVPVWGIESINKKGFFTGTNKIFVDPQKGLELAPFAVKGGDIIMSRSGTVGELCRLPDDAPYGLLSTNLMKISLDKEVVLPDYFYFLFKGTKSIDAQLSALCSGSTRLFLTQSILAKLLFPLPPLAEQHRIVARVKELLALCDRLEAQLTTTQTESRRLLEAVLHEALK